MFRQIVPVDVPALLALLVQTGLFEPDGLEEIEQLLTDHFGDKSNPDHCWIVEEEAGLVSVAYYAPERMTEGTWNLYLIAVHPAQQGKGRGTALIRYVERALAARGERLLLVETSGLPSFERTRAFYIKCGYEQEARIRDFYTAGEDKIVYRKSLTVVAK